MSVLLGIAQGIVHSAALNYKKAILVYILESPFMISEK